MVYGREQILSLIIPGTSYISIFRLSTCEVLIGLGGNQVPGLLSLVSRVIIARTDTHLCLHSPSATGLLGQAKSILKTLASQAQKEGSLCCIFPIPQNQNPLESKEWRKDEVNKPMLNSQIKVLLVCSASSERRASVKTQVWKLDFEPTAPGVSVLFQPVSTVGRKGAHIHLSHPSLTSEEMEHTFKFNSNSLYKLITFKLTQ